jgi:Spy/CpxP family protein refolding chaperone
MVIAISSGVALAQRPRHEDFGRDPQGRRPTRIDFLARRLDLTDPQKQQATSLFSAAEEAGKELRKSLKKAEEDLNNAAKTGASDQQIEKLAGAMGTLAGQLAANETKARAKFRALLTAEQRQKFDQFPPPGAAMMRGFAGGPPPPGMGMMLGFAGGPPGGPGMGMMPGFAGGPPPPGMGMMPGCAGGPPPPGMGMMPGCAGGPPPPGMGMMPGFAGGPPSGPPGPPPSSEEAPE